MQEKSCNILCMTLANGLLEICSISVKPQLLLQKALLGLCWRHSSPVFTFLGLALVSGMQYALDGCVEWAAFFTRLASMAPGQDGATEKSCHLSRNEPSPH